MPNHLLVADVLGFTNMVHNLSEDPDAGSDNLQRRIDQWTSLVDEIRVESGIENLRLISDTIFVLEEFSPAGLERLLKFAKLLLERGIDASFPVRGAITHGNVVWGDLIYGEPVVSALELEKSQEWIGISGVGGMRMPWSWDLVCCYPVPKKKGKIEFQSAVVWSVPECEDLERKTGSGGLSREGDAIPWEHQTKLVNTLLFSKYVRIGIESNWVPNSFQFVSPAQLFSYSG